MVGGWIIYRYSSVSLAQYMTATHLIFIPIWAFERVMASVNKEDENDIFENTIMITSSGGCCSKFLVQMLSKIPNTMWVKKLYNIQGGPQKLAPLYYIAMK